MARLWRNNEGTREGKYLVQRRDGTVPEWPYFVMGPTQLQPRSTAWTLSTCRTFGTWPTSSETTTATMMLAIPMHHDTEPTTLQPSPRCRAYLGHLQPGSSGRSPHSPLAQLVEAPDC